MRLLVLLFLSLSILTASTYKEFAVTNNYETNYEEALKKAQKEKKDIMFVMVANFCPWCIKLEKKVLKKKIYDEKIKANYIPLILNREENKYPSKFETPLIPTVYFVDHKEQKIIQKVVGYNNKQDLINIINK